ncbi:TetR/AcrR family transcriptional regulator [Sandaracinobacteroides saxicola]|uniref:TetR/AcrR family transcriptional regulator n=1 Tax=Sandaracinobacteroides saxicola TaxID=2759707 RepID=A0A7G5IHN7_9SPHN|nr:TetR/AcrR family transcriptional regulator [Sandaracinobacteroides saxicola]QMW22879.1 TetR/AcrR family transcriptional regulator [Sandaracinobacteroides saxicola]
MADIGVEKASKTTAPRRTQAERRAATENAIIDAFGRLLSREGIGGLGLNALVKEAGVGKKQVYDYFEGLAGVAGAWVRARTVWRSLEDIIGEPWQTFVARGPAEKLRHVALAYAASLRNNPELCALLSGELIGSPEVRAAVEHVRNLVRADFERVLASDPRLSHPDMLSLNLIAYSAATYLGLRAHHQPRYFGFDLSADMSWGMVMGMFDRVLTLADPDRPTS